MRAIPRVTAPTPKPTADFHRGDCCEALKGFPKNVESPLEEPGVGTAFMMAMASYVH
jgi:hypothetical protein